MCDDEKIKPDKVTKVPENAGIDPSTMRISEWYQESTREDDDPHSPSSNRVSDFPGADRMSQHVREPIKNDEDRLAMKRGDLPPPLPQQVANTRMREDQALQDFYSKSDKMHRAISDDELSQAWFDYGRSVFPPSVRKTGTNVELFNVPTYQCSIFFNKMGSFNQMSDFRKRENLNKPVAKSEKYNITDLSLLPEFWRNNYAHVIMTAEADSLTTDTKQLLEDYGLVGCHSKRRNYLSVHARIDSTRYVRLLWESSE